MRTRRYLLLLFLVAGLVDSGNTAERPPDILDLSCWKLTLPYAAEGTSRPYEIAPPKLAVFRDPRCFFVNEAGDGVVFRAHCTKVTTKNSSYPRCELREMADGPAGSGEGKVVPAQWGTSDGKRHRMVVTQAITAVPPVKKHVVCAQIHDADDDVLMIRLENRRLFVERNRDDDVELDPDYELGVRFAVRIEAADGHIKVWYNDALKMNWAVSKTGCYFKAGCYTQSNTDKGDTPESYGEVVICDLRVAHESPEPADRKAPGNGEARFE